MWPLTTASSVLKSKFDPHSGCFMTLSMFTYGVTPLIKLPSRRYNFLFNTPDTSMSAYEHLSIREKTALKVFTTIYFFPFYLLPIRFFFLGRVFYYVLNTIVVSTDVMLQCYLVFGRTTKIRSEMSWETKKYFIYLLNCMTIRLSVKKKKKIKKLIAP